MKHTKTVLITGGAGFIGHNLALHLKSLGADVCVVDGLQVNNIMSFSSDDVKAKNRDLYLKILFERQRLLRAAGVPLFVHLRANNEFICMKPCLFWQLHLPRYWRLRTSVHE